MQVTYEGSVQFVDAEVGWTLEELRAEIASSSGEYQLLDAGEWQLLYGATVLEGERRSLADLGVNVRTAQLTVRRAPATTFRPGNAVGQQTAPRATQNEVVRLRFDRVIDLDDDSRTTHVAGVALKTRLRDDAVSRELDFLPKSLHAAARPLLHGTVAALLQQGRATHTVDLSGGYSASVELYDDDE
ncbi:hypothetical protein M885DRAFT_616731 [Pelagophyceae sp. CCMP2097]|nr:hypothetical protein M885DRAFT_616731 [Pelagophyceae sp. CCMP2097]